MKNSKKLKKDLNSAYGATATGYIDTDSAYDTVKAMMNSKKFKNLKKVLDSGYVTSMPSRLSDRELISQIFYYSGRSLQDRNYEQVEDAITLHFLIMEYADRYRQ